MEGCSLLLGCVTVRRADQEHAAFQTGVSERQCIHGAWDQKGLLFIADGDLGLG